MRLEDQKFESECIEAARHCRFSAARAGYTVMGAFPDGRDCFRLSVRISGRQLSADRRCKVTPGSVFAVLCFFILTVPGARGLGSMSTMAAVYGGNNTATVCGLRSGADKQSIQCWDSWHSYSIPIGPNVSFLGISGGNGVFCGLADGGLGLFCWSTDGGSRFRPKRVSKDRFLRQMAVGNSHICGLTSTTDNNIKYWRWRGVGEPPKGRFSAIAAGGDFTCGIRESDRSAHCWGSIDASGIPGREPMRSVFAGGSHACGISLRNGSVHCWGKNDSAQLAVPRSIEFESLALGANHSCGRRAVDGTVVCWGFKYSAWEPRNLSFETIAAADRFTCGVLSGNFSVLCWGGRGFESGAVLSSMPKILPRLCESGAYPCQCGEYPDWRSLCANSRRICSPCPSPMEPPAGGPLSPAPAPAPAPPRIITRRNHRAMAAFAVVGSVGTLMGISAILWYLYAKLCSQGRVRDSAGQQTPASPPAPGVPWRQRSGTSSKRGDRPEEFSFLILAMITDNFSAEHKIGAGSFGAVYRATLPDGRAVAIKRSEIRTGAKKKYQENESAFQSELSFLSRLHHKHLVGLVGFCDEADERLLVYEFMPNGSLHDHLHRADESFRAASPLNSWGVRIKVALDAARGIEYLHTYAVPPIIHRDIKSSNILLDGAWNARVSDFGLSLMGPEEDSHLSLMAAGTVGYIDPEYYRMQHLTTKTDVYSFGVVLLELLTGQKAIHKDEGSGGPRNVVDYAIPHILADELPSILDPRLPPPRPYEIEAVTLLGYVGADCVNLEGKDRPSMTEIVASLEKALAVCVQVDAMSRSSSLVLQR